MKKKNLIVFDIDGTLTDSVELHQKVFAEMLYEIGVNVINSNFNSFKHHTDSFISKEIYEDDKQIPISESKIIEFENGLTQKIKLEKINEIRGAKILIDMLENETDFAVCYATGSLLRAAEYKLNLIGIPFDKMQLVASDKIYERENIVSKAISNALAYYKINEFERIISVGDGLWDLLTAQNLGLEFIGVGLKNKKVLIENGAEVVFEDLTEFKIPLK